MMCCMRLFDAEATRAALPFAALIDALRAMFVTGCEVPLRHTHAVAGADGSPAGTVLIMPAWQGGRYLGIKTVNVYPGNAARGLPGLHASYMLYDAATGEPVAVMDGNEITARRTAAASALAASFLAPQSASRLLVVGAGRVARVLPHAYRAVRPIRSVRVWNRSAARASELAQAWRAEGLDAEAVTDLEAGVRWADVVSCATLSGAPLVRGAWLQPGSHLDLIGSFAPDLRESDGEALRGALVYVDTLEAPAKSGDLLSAISEGAWALDQLGGTLADLCRGQLAALPATSRRTVFKSVGTGLEDLAAATLIWDSC